MRLALVFCSLVLIGSYASAQVLAVAGKTQITLDEFKKKYSEIKKEAINPPPPDLFLEDLIRYELGIQEAEKRGLRNDPVVQERIRQEVYKALIEKELGKKVDSIKVTEAEMRSYYKKNPELRSSHILIEFKPDASETERAAALKRANEILAEVKKSKRPFEELVKIYSDDSLSKMNGGDINYQTRQSVVPTYYDALQTMKVGQVGGPVRTLYGYHIIKLTGIRPYSSAKKSTIRAAVFDEKRKDIFDDYFKKLKSKYTVKTNKSLLKSVN